MCGRFTLHTPKKHLLAYFEILDASCAVFERYNIAPTQNVLVVEDNGAHRLVEMRWGLIPSWAKDRAIGNRMINAREETVAEKPAFRVPFRRQRCLVPADGFYEWRPGEGGRGKTPMHIRAMDGAPFAFAGLWDRWVDKGTGEETRSFTIITTAADGFMRPIHDRMPVLLARDAWARWLDSAYQDRDGLLDLLGRRDGRMLEAFEVSRAVNSPRHDAADCITPAQPNL